MENCASKTSQAVVNVLLGDQVVDRVTRERARELKASGRYFFVNHGKDLRQAGPTFAKPSLLRQMLGWRPSSRLWRMTAMNEGRSGQFTIGYPIPYAYEGHLQEPRAAMVNAEPLR